MLIAPLHTGTNEGRSRVENGDLMPLDHLPEAGTVGGSGSSPVRRTLVHKDRCAVGERAVDHIGVAGHPAYVGGTPEEVLLLVVEDKLGSRGHLCEIPSGGVKDPLGLACTAGGIEDIERVFRIHG